MRLRAFIPGALKQRCVRAAALLALAAGLGACERAPPAHLRIEGGDAARGYALIQRYACGACHMIEGVSGARGMVGPPLIAFAQRKIIAGEYPNTPRFLVPWLMNPPALAPRTAMPDMGISEAEARDIATFLLTLGADGVGVYPDAPPLPLATRRESGVPR